MNFRIELGMRRRRRRRKGNPEFEQYRKLCGKSNLEMQSSGKASSSRALSDSVAYLAQRN